MPFVGALITKARLPLPCRGVACYTRNSRQRRAYPIIPFQPNGGVRTQRDASVSLHRLLDLSIIRLSPARAVRP